MYWTEFFTVALVHLRAVASPGPDFAVVVRESVSQGRRAGLFTAWGVGAGILVHVAYSLLGIGVGLASAPASRALTASLPVAKVGMGSAATDLTKDMGGAIFQALLGALLTFAYADYFTKAYDNLPPDQAQEVSQRTVIELGSSYAGAQRVAENAPTGDASKIIAAANHAFTDGKTAAIMVALASTVVGAVVVWLFYPSRQREAAIFAAAQAGTHPADA